jgi:hypothetical protein
LRFVVAVRRCGSSLCKCSLEQALRNYRKPCGQVPCCLWGRDFRSPPGTGHDAAEAARILGTSRCSPMGEGSDVRIACALRGPAETGPGPKTCVGESSDPAPNATGTAKKISHRFGSFRGWRSTGDMRKCERTGRLTILSKPFWKGPRAWAGAANLPVQPAPIGSEASRRTNAPLTCEVSASIDTLRNRKICADVTKSR